MRRRLRRYTLLALLTVTAGALWVPRHPPPVMDDAVEKKLPFK